jgi:pSer/pThr/pTyr-binding forkhead associated (FHA) protein
MLCPYCKGVVKEGLKTCPNCGRKIEEDTMILTPEDIETQEVEVLPEEAKVPTIAVKRGPSAGSRFSLDKGDILLGRDPASDIFLNDITVSRRHARIQIKGNKAFLEDLGSLNGTYLNGVRIEKASLKNGDEIQVGKFKLVFFLPERW